MIASNTDLEILPPLTLRFSIYSLGIGKVWFGVKKVILPFPLPFQTVSVRIFQNDFQVVFALYKSKAHMLVQIY